MKIKKENEGLPPGISFKRICWEEVLYSLFANFAKDKNVRFHFYKTTSFHQIYFQGNEIFQTLRFRNILYLTISENIINSQEIFETSFNI